MKPREQRRQPMPLRRLPRRTATTTRLLTRCGDPGLRCAAPPAARALCLRPTCGVDSRRLARATGRALAPPARRTPQTWTRRRQSAGWRPRRPRRPRRGGALPKQLQRLRRRPRPVLPRRRRAGLTRASSTKHPLPGAGKGSSVWKWTIAQVHRSIAVVKRRGEHTFGVVGAGQCMVPTALVRG